MLEFPWHDRCDLCDLHEQCKTRGIPTRAAGLAEIGLPVVTFTTGNSKAVVFIGEAPGYHEDIAGISWVGWAGKLLQTWIATTWHLNDYADIYLTNTCRCRPPGNETPKNRHLKACRPHLLADLELIIERYGHDNTFIVAMGAPAVNTLIKLSIRKALLYQGQPLIPRDATWEKPIRTFFTYHPARCAPRRSPETVHTIDAHMRRLLAALRDEAVPVNALPPIEYAPDTFGEVEDGLAVQGGPGRLT